MTSTVSAGKAASSITFWAVSLMASVAFSVPLLDAGGAATGAPESHVEASRLAFSSSAFQGFDGTENHESFDVFVCGSAWLASGVLVTAVSGDGRSRSFTGVTSSTAVGVFVEIFSCEAGELTPAHASVTNGVLGIAPVVTAGSSGMLGGGAGASAT